MPRGIARHSQPAGGVFRLVAGFGKLSVRNRLRHGCDSLRQRLLSPERGSRAPVCELPKTAAWSLRA